MRDYEIHPPNGIPTTIQLDDEEAKRLGLTPVGEKPAVKTKQHTPLNKTSGPHTKSAEGDAGS